MGIPDTGRVTLHVEKGVVHVRTSAACIGQGIGTITCQIVCEVTGLRPDQVTWDTPDTSIAPNSGNTTASRQTLFTGEATRRAATELKWALEGRDLSAVEGVDFHQEYTGITDKLGSPRPQPHQPHRLRLRHPSGGAGRRRKDQAGSLPPTTWAGR